VKPPQVIIPIPWPTRNRLTKHQGLWAAPGDDLERVILPSCLGVLVRQTVRPNSPLAANIDPYAEQNKP